MVLQELDSLIIDTVPSLVIVLDSEGRVVRFNRACQKLTGYSAEHVVGRPMWEALVAPEDRAKSKAIFARLIGGESPIVTQTDWVVRSGTRRRIAWTIVTSPDDSGRVRFLMGTGQDITGTLETEPQLRDYRLWLTKLIETAHEGIGIIDGAGRLIYVNPRMAEIVGYTVEEILGKPFYEFWAEAEQSEAHRRLADRQRGVAETYEVRLRRRDGSEIWVQNKTNPMLDEEGRMIASLGMISDISERKHAEEALRQSEERFRFAVEKSPDMMFYQDPDLRFTWLSKPGRSRTTEQMMGRTEFDLMPPEDARRLQEIKRRVMATGVGERSEIGVRQGDSIRYYDLAIEQRRDAAGNVVGIIGYSRDITERKQAEQALTQMNDRLERLVAQRTEAAEQQSRILRSVLQSMGEAVIVADKNANVLLVNPAAERIAGPARPEPHQVESCAKPHKFYRADGATPYEPHEIPLARAVRGESVDEEMFINRPDRPEGVWISATARPLRDEAGELAGGVLVARDTTERHRNEEMTRRSEQHYRELAERNRLLLRELDHRVRNNLSALLGLTSLMRHRTESVEAFAEDIDSRIRGMAHVHQMLATAGWQPVGLRSLIDSTLHAMQHRTPHRIGERVEGPAVSIPPRSALPLAMIIVEWFTNSCKYGAHSRPEGSLHIAWECAEGLPVRLTWRERGSSVARPGAPSLGTELVGAFASRELLGAASSRFVDDGIEHVLEFQPGLAR